MTSQKLSDITTLSQASRADLLYTVDVSDTTDGAGGTSKSITVGQIASAICISQEINLGSNVSPSDVEALLAIASSEARPLVLDGDFTLSGDVLVDEPVYIILMPGITVSMANSPTWDNGVSAADNTRYLGGMFMFRTGAEGSVFDGTNGAFAVNKANAGSVAGEAVQSCAIAVFGCDNVTLRGTPTVNTSFNGVTVVDSDYFRMTEPWHTVSAENATLDIEASDHGFAVASSNGSEETVDVQMYCDDWDIRAVGEACTQNVLEINNAWNIRAHVSSLNCQSIDVFDYADNSSADQRWTARGRAYRVNEGHSVVCRARYDSSFSNLSAHQTFTFTDCDGLTYDCAAEVNGTTGRVSYFFHMETGGDNYRNAGKVSIKSDSNNLDAGDTGLIYFNSGRQNYCSIFASYPLAAGDSALLINNCQECVFDIQMIEDTGGSGIGVSASGTLGTTVNLRNVDNIFGAATDVDISGVTSGTLQQYS